MPGEGSAAADPGEPGTAAAAAAGEEGMTAELVAQVDAEHQAAHPGERTFRIPAGVNPETGELDDQELDEPAAEPPTEDELEQMRVLEELDKAQESYERKVRKIVGPEAPLVPCSHCEGIGFDLGGGAEADELAEHEHFRGCHECGGHGQVRTGSKVSGHDVAQCPGCGGRGYLTLQPQTQNGTEQREPIYGLEPWMGDPNVAPVSQPA